MMTETLYSLEKSVDNANQQLDTLQTKLVKVEKNILPDPVQNPEVQLDSDCVMELLESVSDVTNEYVTLRKDLTEMHQLQQEMSTNLRYQMRLMTQTFGLLKQKIEANNLQPHIKEQFARNQKLVRQRSAISLPTRHHSTSTLYHNHK